MMCYGGVTCAAGLLPDPAAGPAAAAAPQGRLQWALGQWHAALHRADL